MAVRLCPQCGKRKLEKGKFKCEPCKKANAIAHMKRSNEAAKAKRHAAPPKPPTLRPCKCKCGKLVAMPKLYHPDCSNRLRLERDKALKARLYKENAKPHRPEPPPPRKVMSEEEAERLATAASERDREINNRLVKKSLGLEVRKDCPLASEVVRPPKEVWKEYEANYKPLTQTERVMNLPLRGDISYY